MNIKNKDKMLGNILVTGGAGFIGIHTSLILLEKGYKVTIIDSLIKSTFKSVERLKNFFTKNYSHYCSNIIFHKGDIRDIDFLENVFEEAKNSNNSIGYVIHLAGLKSVSDSIKYPNQYWDNNLCGTIQLLKVMEKFKCKNFVFSSSATVYSFKEKSPLFESSKVEPFNPYGGTKVAVENVLKDIKNKPDDSWKFVSLRYFNPIGAHPSGEFGEDTSNDANNLFPHICKVATGKQKTLFIYGNNWPTFDGTCIRDYIHIMDIAEGHIAALDFIIKEEKKSFFIPINLGRGKGISVLELVNTFERVNNIKINYEFISRRDGDKDIVFANCQRAKEILDWSPKRDLEQMCRDGWKWQINNPNGYY